MEGLLDMYSKIFIVSCDNVGSKQFQQIRIALRGEAVVLMDCDPGQTNFFQTLQIATKIVKGRIEITSPVNLLKAGDKVGNSEAVLLQKLHINPFDYGLVITEVYDNGSMSAIRQWPLYPHSVANAFKSLIAIAVESGDAFSFAKAGPFKAFLADPSAFACAACAGDAGGDAVAIEEKKEEEEEEEVDMGGGMDMFGDDGGGGDY
ncbi:hypothetical protein JL722_3675 [Aureococcus anophagefferens]|nr:hypothetical protein JL722_3675 [Aureococcus anophagefferens]